MQCYRDTKGRNWRLIIDVAQIKRVKALTGVELHGLLAGRAESLARLLGDPIGLCDVLYALCSQQATDMGICDMEFASGLGGDSLDAAAEAFVQELIDFFPAEKQRLAIRNLWRKSREEVETQLTETLQATQDLDLRQMRSGTSSGASRGS